MKTSEAARLLFENSFLQYIRANRLNIYIHILILTLSISLLNSHSKTAFTSKKISLKNSKGENEEFEVLLRSCQV